MPNWVDILSYLAALLGLGVGLMFGQGSVWKSLEGVSVSINKVDIVRVMIKLWLGL